MYVHINVAKNAVLKKMNVDIQQRNAFKNRYALKNMVEKAISEDIEFGFHFKAPVFPVELFKDDFEHWGVTQNDFNETSLFDDPDLIKSFSSWDEFLEKMQEFQKKPGLNFRQAQSKAQKDKKRQNSQHEAALHMKRVIENNETFMTFDVELYEDDHSLVTEIGWVVVKGDDLQECEHIIIDDYLDKRNGKYVPDYKEHFLFGESKTMTLDDGIKALAESCRKYQVQHFIGQAINLDFKYLEKSNPTLCLIKKSSNMLDTGLLTRGLNGDKNTMSIEKTLDFFNIKHDKLHNAGNDAYFNWQMIRALHEHYKKKLNKAQKLKP